MAEAVAWTEVDVAGTAAVCTEVNVAGAVDWTKVDGAEVVV